MVFASSNSYQGETEVYTGALVLQNSNALNSNPAEVLDGGQIQLQTPTGGAAVSVNSTLVLSGTGLNTTGALMSNGGANTWSGNITLEALPGFSQITYPNGFVALGAALGATLTVTGSIGDLAASGEPSGLLVVDPGTVVLAAANTYGGSTEVRQGLLDIQNANALGARIDASANHTIWHVITMSNQNTGTFTLSFDNASTPALPWGDSAADVQQKLDTLLATTLGFTGASVTVTQVALTIPPTAEPTPSPAGLIPNPFNGYLYTVTFNGSLAGTGLFLSAVGDIAELTTAKAFLVAAGNTDAVVDSGAEIEMDGSTSPASGSPATNLTVSNYTLTLNGTGMGGAGALYNLVGNNNWNGPIKVATASAIGVANTTTLSLTGGVSGAGINKVGSTTGDGGTLIFPVSAFGNNQANTTITNGTVQGDGTIGNVTLNGGTLSGNNAAGNAGTVGVITQNAIGGIIDPGDNYPTENFGSLAAAGGTLSATDQFFVDLSATNGVNDLLSILNGNLNLNGASLTGLIPNGGIPIGNQYTIIQTDMATHQTDVVTGHFAGLATAPTFGGVTATAVFINGEKFEVDYFPDHVTITRELANVTLTITATTPTPVYGQPEVFSVAVTPESDYSVAPPTGTVIFNITPPSGGSFQYPEPIVGGVATFNPANLAPLGIGGPLTLGTWTVTSATYDGISNGIPTFNMATATPMPLTVNVIPAPTHTTLTSTGTTLPTPVYGQTIVFTATVASTVNPIVAGAALPTGTVSFYNGTVATANLLGTGTLQLVSGVMTATFSTASLFTPLPAGINHIIAVYNADGSSPNNYVGSQSATLNQNVNQDKTTTVVSGTPNPSIDGQQVTFTASVTVNAPGNGTPTGAVTFTDLSTGTVIGTGTWAAAPGVNDVQTLTFTPPALNSTFTLTYTPPTGAAVTTAAITYAGLNATTENNIQNALNALLGANTTLVGSPVGNTFSITFENGLGSSPQNALTMSTGGSVGTTVFGQYAVETTSVQTSALTVGNHSIQATYSTNAIQTLTLAPPALNSTFTLTFITAAGKVETTGPITYAGMNATTQTNIQIALNAALGANTTVVGAPVGNSFSITFQNTLGGAPRTP